MRAVWCTAALGLGGFIVGVVGVGCGPKAVPLTLGSEWPSDPPSLEVATKTWTRDAQSRGGFDTDKELIIDVDATFRSPQWRAAYVEHIRQQGSLSKSDIGELRASQEKEATEHHQFVLLVATHDRRINDLAKNERSSWQVRLRNSKGAEVAPTKIYKDRRPPTEVGAELPHLGPFDEIYIAEFPGDFELLGFGANEFQLRVFGARAGVELTWTAEN